MSWFKKEEPLTVDKAIEFLEQNSEKLDNKKAEKLMIIIAKSSANKITQFRVKDDN